MSNPINTLFYYLEKEGIAIDRSEFEFQAQSHPNYPSILSITDTLNFFSINNVFTSIDFSEIENIPNRFVALLTDDNGATKFFLVERKKQNYFLFNKRKPIEISITELERRWNKIVLLVENLGEIKTKDLEKKHNRMLPALIILLSVLFFIKLDSFLYAKLFIFFPVIGIMLSIIALKDLFGIKNDVINKFCNISVSTNCQDVINSSKWKLFKYLSFSDLSIVFFISQIVALFFSFMFDDGNSFLLLQRIILYGSIPVIGLSIYYQKRVEKKWCPICLSISALLILELLYLYLISFQSYTINTVSIFIFIFCLLLIYYSWSIIKNMLLKLSNLKKFQLKSIRSLRDYDSFKTILLSKTRIDIPKTNIVLGNKDSKTILTIITNPFCGYCKEVHEIINKIIDRKGEELQVQIILKSNFEYEDENSKYMFRSLINIFNFKGELEFKRALKNWFDNKNIETWLNIYSSNSSSTQFDEVFLKEYEWCSRNEFNFTPAIFINGYKYPNKYDRNELDFFINEIIEDNDFN